MTDGTEVESDAGSGSHSRLRWSDEARKNPKSFSGVINRRVVGDLQRLFRRKARKRELITFLLGILTLGSCLWSLYLSFESLSFLPDALYCGLLSISLFGGAWALANGWARRLLGIAVSGEVHSAGIVVAQLDARASWGEFQSAWINDSTVLLFQDPKERTPRALSFDGLPLHRSFFERGEDWEDVVQLIREAVPGAHLARMD